MRKTGLISSNNSNNSGPNIKDMQVLDEQSKAYFNFINSLKSESTRKSYTYCIEKFLGHYERDLDQFLFVHFLLVLIFHHIQFNIVVLLLVFC